MPSLSTIVSEASNAETQEWSNAMEVTDLPNDKENSTSDPGLSNLRPDHPLSNDHKSRTNLRSLLPTSSPSSMASRKGRSSEAGVSNDGIDRASISMPPPASKSILIDPSTTSSPRLSMILGQDDALGSDSNLIKSEKEPVNEGSAILDDLEKTPNLAGTAGNGTSSSYASLVLPGSAQRPAKMSAVEADTEGNRLSFSSLYSMGSALYSGATGAASGTQSTTSSNAGSVKGGITEKSTLVGGSLSPSMGPNKGETMSSITTATDPISITTQSHTLNTGLTSYR